MLQLKVLHAADLARQGFMSPKPREPLAARAQELHARLSSRQIDVLGAAEVGRRLFTDAGDHVRARWLSLELNGYDTALVVKPLHVLLCVAESERLVQHVATYRAQRGRSNAAGHEEFHHFFVEPLWDLVVARRSVGCSAGAALVQLGFTPCVGAALAQPREATFTRDVFARIVDGFAAALQLQLETLSMGANPCP